jgi:hypothetical protein
MQDTELQRKFRVSRLFFYISVDKLYLVFESRPSKTGRGEPCPSKWTEGGVKEDYYV